MERRIFGIENEYGVTCTLRGQRRLSPDEVARYLFKRVVSWGRSSNVFLENGARLYLDVGSHPEYATPECDSIEDLVAHDKAGERILGGAGRLSREPPARRGHPRRHLPVQEQHRLGRQLLWVPRELPHEPQGRLLALRPGAHPVLREPADLLRRGQGAADGPRGAMFCLCQRAEHIWEGVSSATTRSRPIINTRDEPHADAERFRRLHVIVGDSNMSEYATFLKVGATSILLRMLEDPSVVIRDLTLEDPIRAIREISHDITCRREVRLANGRELSALDIQREYLERAMRYEENRGLPPLEERALSMWKHCMEQIEKDPLGLDRECDWVIKYRLVEAYRARHQLPLGHPKVALLDLQYHDVDRSRGDLLPPPGQGPRRARNHRRGHPKGDGLAPGDDEGPAEGRVHKARQGEAPRLHR